MMDDVEIIVSQWSNQKPLYKELGSFVRKFLIDKLYEAGLKSEVVYRTKDLVSIVKKIKKKRKEKTYHLNDLKDRLGVRIICNYNSELEIIDELIKQHFQVDAIEYKKDELDFDKLGYTSNHYDLRLGENESFKDSMKVSDLIFELQVRTLNQHAWSNTAHELTYKQESDLSNSLKRRIYRLSSLYEIADDEFESVNQVISQGANVEVVSIIKLLEPYIYRFAKSDYDRDTSLFTIKNILKAFLPEEIKRLKTDLPNFIETNKVKIENIFTENKERYYQYPSLTQPEILLIWYCLSSFEYRLKDNWSEHSDFSEFELASNLWGLIIE